VRGKPETIFNRDMNETQSFFVSPAENSKPPSGGTITNNRCIIHIRDAAHSESCMSLSRKETLSVGLFCKKRHINIKHSIGLLHLVHVRLYGRIHEKFKNIANVYLETQQAESQLITPFMCACACVRDTARERVLVYICRCVHLDVYMNVYAHVCLYTYMYVSMHICSRVCVHTCAHIH